jgi:hypothetical protein
MKQLFTLTMIALALTCIMSCSKTQSFTNYFTFNGATYPVSITSRDSSRFSITFADPATSLTGTITCGLDTFAYSSSGQYKIVNGLYTTTPSQMTLQLTIGLNNYYATGHDNVSASITKSTSGVYSIYIPPVWVARTPGDTLGAPPVDSAKLSATITEIK